MSNTPDHLDDSIRRYMAERHIPAAVVGVFRDGDVVTSRSYGLANVETETPATVDTVFEIGSVSKQFTATALLIDLQEGKLSLGDPISQFIEDLPTPWQRVTLRQLLNHTSGIPDIEEIFGYSSYRNIYTTSQIFEVANSKPMDFNPGEGWKYSNTGYYLLALCLEEIGGKSYGELLKERIFDPLAMSHTGESNPNEVIPNRARGYEFTSTGVLENRDPMQPTACKGAGTLVSTLGDMARWDAAINHHRLLAPESQQMMWTPAQTHQEEVPCGFGWFISPWLGHASVEHAGGTAGFSCDYRRFQDLGLSVMVFTNLYNTNVGGIEFRTLDTVYPGLSYLSAQPIREADPDRSRLLLDAMAAVANNGARPPIITEPMWNSYADESRHAWGERLAGLRKFELIEARSYPPRNGAFGQAVVETRVYRLETGNQLLIIVFELDADGGIALQTRQDY